MTDDEFDDLMRRYRKWKGYAPLTAAEADKAFDEAESLPISDEEIDALVERVTSHDKEQQP